jgi:hypothetical protein
MGRIIRIVTLTMLSTYVIASGQPATLVAHTKSLEGRTYRLKIDLVEVHYGLRGVDAVDVLESGDVRYRVSSPKIVTSTSEDFLEKVQGAGDIRVMEHGSQVVIDRIDWVQEYSKQTANIVMEKVGGVGHSVRLRFPDVVTREGFDRLFRGALAESEKEYEESRFT